MRSEVSTTNTQIVPARTAEISFLHYFVFLFDFHPAGRAAVSVCWALTLLPLTHYVPSTFFFAVANSSAESAPSRFKALRA